jgi:WD40 repeat protein
MLWDLGSGQELATLPARKHDQLYFHNYDLSPDGGVVIYEQGEGEVALWKCGNVRATLKGKFSSHVFSPDGAVVAINDGGTMRLYDVGTGEARVQLPGEGCWSGEVLFCPEGQLAALHESDLGSVTVRLCDVATREIKTILDPHAFRDTDGGRLKVSRDARLLFWEGRTGHITLKAGEAVLWDIESGPPRVMYKPPLLQIREMALDHNIGVVESDPEDTQADRRTVLKDWLARQFGLHQTEPQAQLRFLDLTTTRTLATVEIPVGWAKGQWRLSPDGRTVAVRDEQGRVRLWDVPPRKPIAFAATLALFPVGFLVLIRYARRRKKRPPTAVAAAVAG